MSIKKSMSETGVGLLYFNCYSSSFTSRCVVSVPWCFFSLAAFFSFLCILSSTFFVWQRITDGEESSFYRLNSFILPFITAKLSENMYKCTHTATSQKTTLRSTVPWISVAAPPRACSGNVADLLAVQTQSHTQRHRGNSYMTAIWK